LYDRLRVNVAPCSIVISCLPAAINIPVNREDLPPYILLESSSFSFS
jgi:hypothetical protein